MGVIVDTSVWSLALQRRNPVDNPQTEVLEKHILRRLKPGDEECDVALKEACPGRLIGDVRRPGEVKGRGAKQGFKENIGTTDGPNFNYHSHVAKMDSVRSLTLRGRRRCPKTGKMRRLATKDIRTAFLQSDKHLDTDPRKHITFKHPITKEPSR